MPKYSKCSFELKTSRVVILHTSSETVIGDYEQLMRLADYGKCFPNVKDVILKLNLSWSLFFPACSTPVWQLEGVLKVLVEDGFRVFPVENQTVVTHPWRGAYSNKWLPIFEKYAVKFIPLPNVEWIEYEPKSELLALDELFGSKIPIPSLFVGRGIIHLATLKTHGHATITCAVKNSFGGLIPKYRHHAHRKIHEVLVDLLQIQREIHPGVFAVVDGTVMGDGAGPRTMIPREGNILIAGTDQVAVDSVAARIMGFNPMDIKYLRIAHEKGLGCADLDQIDVVGGLDLGKINFKFKVKRSPVVFFDQLLRGKPVIDRVLFHTSMFKLAILASNIYHDRIWYPIIGRIRVNRFLKTDWGRLWLKYPYGEYPRDAQLKEWNPY
ncbi:DUF362 domain-containing protein [Candidatus Bathyarchaeota archaeon]|nr:DUF362 domain-containing protein [Candidatus Bathyarchaeota archaeon]MBS7613656.1 DUF362 domain-containing protein [Candidatus Bathyarchaeota archaeon]MBS7618038.1 DUF362 domain-containing protein [Candidatus Bathyarchaeota archaeon]